MLNVYATVLQATLKQHFFLFFCLLGSIQATVQSVTQHMTGLRVHVQPGPFVREGRIVVTE